MLKQSDISFMFSLKTTLLILSWFMSTTLYADSSKTYFGTGHYDNSENTGYADNQYLQKILTIPDAEALEVTVEGEIEDCCQSPSNENVERCCRRSQNKRCCDFIIIRDSTNQNYTFTGQIQEKFTVLGHSITVIFKSDSTTTAKGVRVNITPRSAFDMFSELKTRLLNAAETILKQDANSAYLKLEQSLKQLETLSAQVESTQDINEIIEPIARMLIMLGQTYREIASQRGVITLAHQEQLNIIKELRATISNRIGKATQEKQNYAIMLDKAQNTLSQTINSLEKQKIQISVNSYKRNIEKLRMQEMMWTSFYKIQETLENLLKQYIQKIELLLHFLEMSGQVYESAANATLLKETTVMAFDKLVDFTELQNIVLDIEQSEQEIQAWIEKIKQANFQQSDLP